MVFLSHPKKKKEESILYYFSVSNLQFINAYNLCRIVVKLNLTIDENALNA